MLWCVRDRRRENMSDRSAAPLVVWVVWPVPVYSVIPTKKQTWCAGAREIADDFFWERRTIILETGQLVLADTFALDVAARLNWPHLSLGSTHTCQRQQLTLTSSIIIIIHYQESDQMAKLLTITQYSIMNKTLSSRRLNVAYTKSPNLQINQMYNKLAHTFSHQVPTPESIAWFLIRYASVHCDVVVCASNSDFEIMIRFLFKK